MSHEKGAFVSNIDPKGPSKMAGIEEGDVILKFNNIDIIRMTDLPRVVAESDVGSTALVEIWRKNKIITIKVTLGELPEKSYVKRNDIKDNSEEHFVDSLGLAIAQTSKKNGVTVIKIDRYPTSSNLSSFPSMFSTIIAPPIRVARALPRALMEFNSPIKVPLSLESAIPETRVMIGINRPETIVIKVADNAKKSASSKGGALV